MTNPIVHKLTHVAIEKLAHVAIEKLLGLNDTLNEEIQKSLNRVFVDLAAHRMHRLIYWTRVQPTLNPFKHDALGWYHFAGTPDAGSDYGIIYLPKLSVPVTRIWAEWFDDSIPAHRNFTDVLRHEYGHALADALHIYGELPRIWHLDDAFTPYGGTSPDEDFAETFMLYLKHKGKMPANRTYTPNQRRKWRYVAACIRKVRTLERLPLYVNCGGCSEELNLADGRGEYDCPDCGASHRVTAAGEIHLV